MNPKTRDKSVCTINTTKNGKFSPEKKIEL